MCPGDKEGQERAGEEGHQGAREILGAVATFIILIVVTLLWVYIDLKTYQIVYLIIISLLYVNYTSIELSKRKKLPGT